MIRGRPKIALLPLLLLLLLSLPALGRTLEWATVFKIIDGDTLVANYQGKDQKVRLIDGRGTKKLPEINNEGQTKTEEG